METEMLMILQCGKHCIRNTAHTYLQGCSVRYHCSNMVADCSIYGCRFRSRNFNQRIIHLYDCVYLRHMDQGITIGERHGLVDLNDHLFRTFGRADGKIGRHSERAISFLIRRRDIKEHSIEWQRTVTEKARDLTEKGRDSCSVTICKPTAYVIGYKKALDYERVFVFRSAIRSIALPYRKCRIDLYSLEFMSSVSKSLRQHFRYGCAALDINAVT